MINPGYRLDVSGSVLESIIRDTPAYTLAVRENLIDSTASRFVCAAADLLLPNQGDLRVAQNASAFIVGGATTLETLQTSDIPKKTKEKVYKQFSSGMIPIGLLSEDPEQTHAAFNEQAAYGRISHPEIKEHLEYLLYFYSEKAMDAECGKYALLGGFFCARQLDRSYDHVIKIEVANVIGTDLETVNWEELLN